MPAVTIVLGMALVVLGLVGFYATGATHYTALIPAGFGAVFFLLGTVALWQSLRRHAMHVTSMLGLLGFAFTVRGGLLSLPTLISLQHPASEQRPEAIIAKSVMAILCGVYFILCVMSFVAARLRRRRAD